MEQNQYASVQNSCNLLQLGGVQLAGDFTGHFISVKAVADSELRKKLLNGIQLNTITDVVTPVFEISLDENNFTSLVNGASLFFEKFLLLEVKFSLFH